MAGAYFLILILFSYFELLPTHRPSAFVLGPFPAPLFFAILAFFWGLSEPRAIFASIRTTLGPFVHLFMFGHCWQFLGSKSAVILVVWAKITIKVVKTGLSWLQNGSKWS